MDKFDQLVIESAKLVRLIDRYKGRHISSEQAEIRKQAERVAKITNPEINKAIQLQQTLFK